MLNLKSPTEICYTFLYIFSFDFKIIAKFEFSDRNACHLLPYTLTLYAALSQQPKLTFYSILHKTSTNDIILDNI